MWPCNCPTWPSWTIAMLWSEYMYEPDERVMHRGSRNESCAFGSANKKCASNNDKTASSLRSSTWMCSDEWVMHRESRHESCAFWSAKKKCANNNGRTACRGWKWGPFGSHMASKWATSGAVKVSVRPRTWHDVAIVVPRPIFLVPIKQFWFSLASILVVFGH